MATRNSIVDCLDELGERIANTQVQLWLETHGDFALSAKVLEILTPCPQVRIVWDPANAFMQQGESPAAAGRALNSAISHVHMKDLRRTNHGWVPVLSGLGNFPWKEMRTTLEGINYSGFLSFEWEKKWHPEIEEPELVISHFVSWFRGEWEAAGGESEGAGPESDGSG